MRGGARGGHQEGSSEFGGVECGRIFGKTKKYDLLADERRIGDKRWVKSRKFQGLSRTCRPGEPKDRKEERKKC